MSMPAPPGFLSPAAFPFPNGPFPLVNDAPVPGAPYLIGTMSGPASATLTMTMTTGSNAGDTIVVFTASASNVAVRCTDTEGNSYSLAALPNAQSERINQFTAVNPAPLHPGDSVTVTWASTGNGFTVIGLPGAAAGAPGGNLIPDASTTGSAGVGTAMTATIAAASLSRSAEVAVGYVMIGSAAGPVNWPPDWTAITSGIISSGPYRVSAAYKLLTSKAQVRATILSAVADPPSGLIISTLMPETRYAPNRPGPDMPPGLQSPGAWQYAPLTAPEGPWSTRYNPGPNKWTQALPAVTASLPALARGTAKILAAAATAGSRLATAGPAISFTLGLPGTGWSVGLSAIGMSHLSTEYVQVPVAATRSGSPYNPTGDTVAMAFMPTPTQVPQSGDWVTGSWDGNPSNLIYPSSAKVLVGPAGAITLGIGTYIMYVRITDDPEVPVLTAGQLQIS